MPKISILMATYNSEKYIEKTIRSILSQSYKDFELIVVNDGSTDQTDNIISKLLLTDSRLNLISQENKGPGGARNTAIESANGEYLLIIDDDDTMPDDTLKRYADVAHDSPDLIISSYEMAFDSKPNQLFSLDDFSIQSHDEFLNALPKIIDSHLGYITWNKLYRKEIIDSNNLRFTDYRSCEDRLFNILFYRYVKKLHCISTPTYIYRVHTNSGLNNKFLIDRAKSLDEFYSSICGLYSNAPNDYAISVFSKAYITGIYATIISTFHSTCTLDRKGKRKYISDIIHSETLSKALKHCKMSVSMSLPIISLKTKSVIINKLCARLIHFINNNMHSLFMKLKHKK